VPGKTVPGNNLISVPILSRRALLAAAGAFAFSPARATPKLKIAFIYTGPVADGGYTYQHDLARQAIQHHFGGAVETHFVENVGEGQECERVLRQLADGGADMVFSTSFSFMNAVTRVAKLYPEVKFEQATGYKTAPNVAEYNLRFYEGRAVCGTLAGLLSKTGIAGYVAAYPIPEVVMGINAFTLAARAQNPHFRVRVVWISSWIDPGREADAANSLIDQGADILTDHMDSAAVMQTAQARGVQAFGQSADRSAVGPTAQLTAIIDNWAPYCIARVQSVLDGSWRPGSVWLGMKQGGVELAPYGPAVTPPARAAADRIKTGIIDGSVHPFAGPIIDQSGRLRVAAGQTMSDDDILKMDFFVQGA